MKDLIFCGFISLRNKINKESKKAIKELSNMGCELIMSTGDNALNSIGTGFEVGLLDSNKKFVINSSNGLKNNIKKYSLILKII